MPQLPVPETNAVLTMEPLLLMRGGMAARLPKETPSRLVLMTFASPRRQSRPDRRFRRSGVVDQHVELAEFFHRLRDGEADGSGIGDIRLKRQRAFWRQFAGDIVRPGVTDQQHVGTLLRKPPRQCRSARR